MSQLKVGDSVQAGIYLNLLNFFMKLSYDDKVISTNKCMQIGHCYFVMSKIWHSTQIKYAFDLQ